jgi:hypothetical protein
MYVFIHALTSLQFSTSEGKGLSSIQWIKVREHYLYTRNKGIHVQGIQSLIAFFWVFQVKDMDTSRASSMQANGFFKFRNVLRWMPSTTSKERCSNSVTSNVALGQSSPLPCRCVHLIPFLTFLIRKGVVHASGSVRKESKTFDRKTSPYTTEENFVPVLNYVYLRADRN